MATTLLCSRLPASKQKKITSDRNYFADLFALLLFLCKFWINTLNFLNPGSAIAFHLNPNIENTNIYLSRDLKRIVQFVGHLVIMNITNAVRCFLLRHGYFCDDANPKMFFNHLKCLKTYICYNYFYYTYKCHFVPEIQARNDLIKLMSPLKIK